MNVYSLSSRDTFVYADHADDDDIFNGHSGSLWTCLERDCVVGYTQEQSMKTHAEKCKHKYFQVPSPWGKERHIKGDVTKSIPQGAPRVNQRSYRLPLSENMSRRLSNNMSRRLLQLSIL